jgi:hypothetical protein
MQMAFVKLSEEVALSILYLSAKTAWPKQLAICIIKLTVTHDQQYNKTLR